MDPVTVQRPVCSDGTEFQQHEAAAGEETTAGISTCTLKELCPEDKQKVAKLVKQVVELGQNNQVSRMQQRRRLQQLRRKSSRYRSATSRQSRRTAGVWPD
ncbi:hypothetical protein COO60DRAFT_680006 [Scenedesmus sp. NREL 46B-D3]|nr:hypothetical protein COO60DRAFT_680006 [Scenedesmus sp. NREL 46B-D3]